MSDPLRSLSEYSRYIAESFSKPNPPDIKHHRVPATEMSYNRPDLPALINEIEELGKS